MPLGRVVSKMQTKFSTFYVWTEIYNLIKSWYWMLAQILLFFILQIQTFVTLHSYVGKVLVQLTFFLFLTQFMPMFMVEVKLTGSWKHNGDLRHGSAIVGLAKACVDWLIRADWEGGTTETGAKTRLLHSRVWENSCIFWVLNLEMSIMSPFKGEGRCNSCFHFVIIISKINC